MIAAMIRDVMGWWFVAYSVYVGPVRGDFSAATDCMQLALLFWVWADIQRNAGKGVH